MFVTSRRALCALVIASMLVGPSSFGCRDRTPVLRVFAGQGLINVFDEFKEAFESTNDPVRIEISYAGTGTLRHQLQSGAVADVFAAPHTFHMDILREEGYFAGDGPEPFASNRLVLIVPANYERTPRSPADLSDPAYRRIAVGDPDRMAAGSYTRQVLDYFSLQGQLEARSIPCEHVRQVLMYTARGEVDAGFVFQSDAATEPDRVRVVWTAPTEMTDPIEFEIGILAGGDEPEWAARFVDFVHSPEGLEILHRHGFPPPL